MKAIELIKNLTLMLSDEEKLELKNFLSNERKSVRKHEDRRKDCPHFIPECNILFNHNDSCSMCVHTK